jgi:hypothetical protein
MIDAPSAVTPIANVASLSDAVQSSPVFSISSRARTEAWSEMGQSQGNGDPHSYILCD